MSDGIDGVMNLLSRSGIISEGQLRSLRERVASDLTLKTVETFARELVRMGHLTEFQAAEVCRGKADQLMLGDYLLIDQIGHGGMGEVFRARHGMMNREVAIKLMQPESMNSFEHVQRFRREVEAAAQLTHPNIVSAFDAGEFAGHYFLVMEYVRGQDLRRCIRKNGPLPTPLVLNYLIQAAQGLEYAHKRGVIHRDVKPSNLLLADDGAVKVLDLGLSLMCGGVGADAAGSMTQSELTESGQVMGTVDFMSPEQALNAHDVDPRCDVYSLGCTLHFLLTGLPPYLGESMMSRLVAHREHPIPQLTSRGLPVSQRLNDLFRSMMAKKAEDRLPSMSEVIAGLRLCLMDLSDASEIPETVRFTRDMSDTRSVKAIWLGIGCFLLLTMSLLAAWLRPWETPLSSDGHTPPTTPATTEPTGKKQIAKLPDVDLTKPFNPLDRMDWTKNIVSGTGWKRDGDSLRTAPGHATLQLPGALPPEYEFRFIATRREASGPLVIGLRIGDHQCFVLLDAARKDNDRVTALGVGNDGKLVNVRKGIQLDAGVPTSVICRVSNVGIDLLVGTETAIHWQGSPSDLKLGAGWSVPDKQSLFLGTNDDAVFELSELQVAPLSQPTAVSNESPK